MNPMRLICSTAIDGYDRDLTKKSKLIDSEDVKKRNYPMHTRDHVNMNSWFYGDDTRQGRFPVNAHRMDPKCCLPAGTNSVVLGFDRSLGIN